MGEESPNHRYLKRGLLTVAPDAGLIAEAEVPGPRGARRAHTLVGSGKSRWKHSRPQITEDDIRGRSERILEDGGAVGVDL